MDNMIGTNDDDLEMTDLEDESVSQPSRNSTLEKSSVWEHFDRNPSNLPGYNVCRKCSTKYKVSTGVSTLRKHLQKHKLNVPIKKQGILVIKRTDPFNKQEQEEHDNYLIEWLICDLQPFSVVDNSHFRAFLNYFCPRYVIPERHQAKGIECC
jgi:hypothetical protein